MNEFKKYRFYDYDKRECRVCGALLAPQEQLLNIHPKETYHIKCQIDKNFMEKGELQ